jgi:hypothetical protein
MLIFKIKISLTLFLLLFVLNSNLIAQTTSEKSIVISKENFSQIISNNNNKQNIEILFNGIGTGSAENIKPCDGIVIIKSNTAEINIGKEKVIVDITNNIDSFREFLEKNGVKYIYFGNLKIRVSNIITQEEANVIEANIIDMAPVPFKAEYNDTTKKESYFFRLYYYETKLRVSMDNYQESLLQGYIDKFQTLIEKTKIRLKIFN